MLLGAKGIGAIATIATIDKDHGEGTVCFDAENSCRVDALAGCCLMQAAFSLQTVDDRIFMIDFEHTTVILSH